MQRTVKRSHAGSVINLCGVFIVFQITLWSSAEGTDPHQKVERFCGLDVSHRIGQTGLYNLTSLQKWSPWLYNFDINGSPEPKKLEFNVCGGVPSRTVPSDDPCSHSTVCEVSGEKRNSFSTLENSADDEISFVHGLMLFYKGPICPTSRTKRIINVLLSCGQHLGYPRLVLESPCFATFEWSTSGACMTQPKRQEVPCYTYDPDGQLYDLTSLIKPKGGYEVESIYPEDTFSINVCSEIVPDEETGSVPNPSAAIFKTENRVYGVGQLKSGLSFRDGNLQLVYEASDTDTKIPGCNSVAKTVVNFRCPKGGQAKPPLLISSIDCYYEINWETEHACPLATLKGNSSTCSFNKNDHGVDIDLGPLRKTIDQDPYSIMGDVNGTSFEFLLNICGGIPESHECSPGWKSRSVCFRPLNQTKGNILTKTSNSKLKYVDGEVSLTYEGAKSCLHNEELSSTVVINFICNETSGNDGVGVGKFLYEEECHFFFEWPTKYACVKNTDPMCSFTHSTSQFNLAAISTATGKYVWNVVDSVSGNGKSREIFLNLCGQSDGLHNEKNCPVGSLVCLKDNNRYINLGSTMNEPKYNEITKKVEILFTDGEACTGRRKKKTQLSISCSPGQVTKSPVLLHYVDCEAELEWTSALACPIRATIGSDCKVFDANLGLVIDLAPLKSTTSYEIALPDHSYHINVCAPVKVPGCPEDAGGCQKETNPKSDKRSWSLGKSISNLTYRDSFVSLIYQGGTSYRDANKTPRSMSIAFLCDPEAGVGHPLFSGEGDRAYSFRWDTKYACPREVSVDCMIVDPDTHRQYDLSSLTKTTGNWEVMDSEGKRKFYLNICKPINQVPMCKGQSAACMHTFDDNNKVGVATNLGQALEVPEINSDGHLQLRYTYGDACMAYGEKMNYSVTINFICQKGSSTEGPHFLGALGSCQYSFVWSTQAACSIGDELHKECTFQDPATGNTVDLTPLWKKNGYYTVDAQGRKFQLNICGAVGNGGCPQSGANHESIAACEVSSDGKSIIKTIGLADPYVFHASGDGPIRLTYIQVHSTENKTLPQNGNFFMHTEIRFECLYTGNSLKFVNQENDTYFFVFGTPLVCFPDPVDCDVVDSRGLEYDLNSLVNTGSDWMVEQPTGLGSERFYVSFCKPLTGVGGVPCHGAGICKVTPGGLSTFNSLGKQLRPRVLADGTILVEYKDGSQCPWRKTNFSAHVALHCSRAQSELKLQGTGCTYMFRLDTPAACPIKVYKGTNCRVTDQMYGHTFDLSPLRNETSDYKVKVGEYTYLLNVCGPLKSAPGTCRGSAICQTKESDKKFVVNTGKPSQNLTLRDGLIQLVYPDGKDNCHKVHTRSTILSFVCDQSTDGKEEGPSFISEEHDCTYVFKWATRYACPPHVISNCYTQDDKGQLFDLTELSLPQENYVVINPNNRTQKFLLNVCRSLVYDNDQLCHYGSTACLLNELDPNILTKSISIGSSMHTPEIVDNKLQLRYTMGSLCPSDNSRHLETLITFQCDPYAHRGQPEFVNYEPCVYNFLWRTASACAKDVTAKTAGHCTAINPATGFVFDFSSLSSKTAGYKVESENYVFLLDVCDELQESTCKGKAGSCLIKQDSKDTSINSGKANGYLFYSRGLLFLNYTGGDSCEGNEEKQRSTFITFECSREDSGPVIVAQSDDCVVYINWNTPLACENEEGKEDDSGMIRVPCVVHTQNGSIDLSPLMQHETAFHALDITTHIGIYGINVCKTMSSFDYPLLYPPAAVCSLCFGQTKPLSLGTVNKPPYLDSKKGLVIDYVNGSTCINDVKKRYSSRVEFVCNYIDEDKLDIIDVNEEDCQVFFQLNTPLACTAPQVKSLCNFTSEKAGYEMDLAALGNNGEPFRVKDRDGKDTYLLSICHVVKTEGPCKGAGACVVSDDGKEQSLGLVGRTSFFHNGVHLSMVYRTTEECDEQGFEYKQTEIKFYCNPTTGIGRPQLYKSTKCQTIFLWATSTVCHLEHPPCTLFANNKLFDLRELSSISHSWSAADKNDSYWLNICREVHAGVVLSFHNTTCPTYSSVCKVNQENQTTMLGNILTQRLSYREKSSTLILSYDHGDSSLCPNVPGATEPMKASTEIEFTCGNNVGSPVFVGGPDDGCVFRFVWKTSVACENSNTLIDEYNGLLVDKRLDSNDFFLNISVIQNVTFLVTEPYRSEDNYSYSINLKGGVGSFVGGDECVHAAVCQYKPSGTFYRDIGTVGTGKYYLKGNGLRLVLTSHGRLCGKNKSKNVTSIILLQCSTANGLGTPVFQYENNNCDYIFQWNTIAVCPQSKKTGAYSGGLYVVNRRTNSEETSDTLSVPAILGIVLLVLTAVVLVLVLARKERRTNMKNSMKSCFRSIHLPCYTYRDFQCYFLKTSGSLNSQTDGEAVLLAPHESFAKFQDDSDTDPIA